MGTLNVASSSLTQANLPRYTGLNSQNTGRIDVHSG